MSFYDLNPFKDSDIQRKDIEVVGPNGDKRTIKGWDLQQYQMQGYTPTGDKIGEDIVAGAMDNGPGFNVSQPGDLGPLPQPKRGMGGGAPKFGMGAAGPAQSPVLGQSLQAQTPVAQEPGKTPDELAAMRQAVLDKGRADAEGAYNEGGWVRAIGRGLLNVTGGTAGKDLGALNQGFEQQDKTRYDQTVGKYERDLKTAKEDEEKAFNRNLQTRGEARAQGSYDVQMKEAGMKLEQTLQNNDPKSQASKAVQEFVAQNYSKIMNPEIARSLSAAQLNERLPNLQNELQRQTQESIAKATNRLGYAGLESNERIAAGRLEADKANAQKGEKLMPPQAKEIIDLRKGVDAAKNILSLKKQVDTGMFANMGAAIQSSIGADPGKFAQLKQQLGLLGNAYINQVTGAGGSAEEMKRILEVLPTMSQNDPAFIRTIQGFHDLLRGQLDTTLDTYGRAGYNVAGFKDLPDNGNLPPASRPITLTLKDGSTKTVNEQQLNSLSPELQKQIAKVTR